LAGRPGPSAAPDAPIPKINPADPIKPNDQEGQQPKRILWIIPYYTLGKGGFIKRTGYAVSRLFITRTDAGKNTVNISEIVGAGAAAGIGNTYYPAQSNPWVKTYQRWGTQVGLDGVFNVLKEFWPDIHHAVFRGKY